MEMCRSWKDVMRLWPHHWVLMHQYVDPIALLLLQCSSSSCHCARTCIFVCRPDTLGSNLGRHPFSISCIARKTNGS